MNDVSKSIVEKVKNGVSKAWDIVKYYINDIGEKMKNHFAKIIEIFKKNYKNQIEGPKIDYE